MYLSEEDELAKTLSELDPGTYDSVMRKVDRRKWDLIPHPSYIKFSLLTTNDQYVTQKKKTNKKSGL